MAAGLYYTITPKRQTSFYAGAALHHFNKANASFFNEQDGTEHKIFMKTVGHLGARLPIGDEKQIFPRVMVSIQGPHMEIDAGANLRMALNDFSSFALHFGTWLRPVKSDTGFGLDAYYREW